MKKITKKAFTMAEVLMVLAVLGIIAAILIPAIATLKPDQNRVMFKKAYYLTERLIAEIINDEELYTTGSSASNANNNDVGFVNDGAVLKSDGSGDCQQYADPKNPNSQTICAGGRVASMKASVNGVPSNKLCLLFADRLNLISDSTVAGCAGNATMPSAGGWGTPSFKTVDGVWWYFPRGTWTATGANGIKVITIDTNGDKKPNCGCYCNNSSGACTSDTSLTGCSAGTTCKKPDRFAVFVKNDGKMFVKANSKEAEYLKAATTVSDK